MKRFRDGVRSGVAAWMIGAACGLGLLAVLDASAQTAAWSAPELPTIAKAALPREAQRTLQLIRAGGPFPYSKDGIVFGNREHRLPPMPYGYYHEYTVRPRPRWAERPGDGVAYPHDRGVRRIVCGGGAGLSCYYTADHYNSFQRIVG